MRIGEKVQVDGYGQLGDARLAELVYPSENMKIRLNWYDCLIFRARSTFILTHIVVYFLFTIHSDHF